jgi:hypothetical protein
MAIRTPLGNSTKAGRCATIWDGAASATLARITLSGVGEAFFRGTAAGGGSGTERGVVA